MRLNPNDYEAEILNDLAWALNPQCDLVRALPNKSDYQPFQAHTHPSAKRLLELTQAQPEALLAFIKEKDHRRIGLYFEDLVEFYFLHANQPSLCLIDKNRQIFEGSTTVGELDFILSDDTKTIHMEAAVKFYLGHEEAGQVLWVGPNCKDRLDLKLSRMATHQLPLGKTALERDHMSKFGASQFWVKGMLFHPYDRPLPLPNYVYPDCIQHTWMTLSHFRQMETSEQHQWRPLPRTRWLTGFAPENKLALSKKAETETGDILDYINANQKPQMFYHTVTDRRLFVTHDSWPNIAAC